MTATPATNRTGIGAPARPTVDKLLLAGAVVVVVFQVIAVGFVFALNPAVVRWDPVDADPGWEMWSGLAGTVVLVTCALAVIVHQRRSLVGWLLLTYSLLDCTEGLADWVALTGLHVPGHLFAGAASWAAFAESLQRPEFGVIFLLLLVFPTGRVSSRRWVPVAWSIVALSVLWFLTHLLRAEPLEEPPFAGLANPLAVHWLDGPLIHYGFLPTAGVLGLLVLVSIVGRFRRSSGDERQQLKWMGVLAAGVAFLVAALGITGILGDAAMSVVGDALGLVLDIGLPVAIALVITRHRLYDLDLVVNGTIVYGLVCAAVLATYAAVVLLASRLVVGVGWTSPVVVAVSTLTAAAVVNPARRVIQRGVDRLLQRRSWRARRMIEEFTVRWRDSAQPLAALQEVLRGALGDPAAEVGWWLRDRDAYVGVNGDEIRSPAEGSGSSALELRSHGEPLAVVVHSADHDRDHRLLTTVAETASLVMENARLQAELLTQLAAVEASRRRLVQAADAERRRVERNLHDGAQQRLVGLAMRVKLASRTAPPDSAAVLTDVVTELQAATRELRELARGIHPAALDEGLGAGLEALVHRIPLAVHIEVPAERLPTPVELTAYYLACESITNAAKHSGASAVAVRAVHADRTLELTVADNGRGGAKVGGGGGLAGLLDRVGAAGGTMSVNSPPGGGTVVVARLPCGC